MTNIELDAYDNVLLSHGISSEFIAQYKAAFGRGPTVDNLSTVELDAEALDAAVYAAMDSEPVEKLKDYWRIMRLGVTAYLTALNSGNGALCKPLNTV